MSAPDRSSHVDGVTRQIADYVIDYVVIDREALDLAHLCLIDTIGCAFEGLGHAPCRALLGDFYPGFGTPGGARVPGTRLDLDPPKAAFDFGAASRWVDFSDTYFGAQGSHPSDNIGGLLAISDYIARRRRAEGLQPLRVRDLLEALVKAYEIQGVLSIDNSFYDVGLDHVLLVKLATAAVATRLLGGGRSEVVSAITNVWVDGHSLSTYRRSPNAGTRKSWAGADATARGLWLAALAMRGEMAYPTALTAPTWGFYDVLFGGKPFETPRDFAATIVKEIQFKVLVPTVFNSQTAAECALRLHSHVKERLAQISRITIEAHATTLRLNAKTGALTTAADRDHCVQYIVAVALTRGRVLAQDYDDEAAADPAVERLRHLTQVTENAEFTAAYRDASKRASANAVQVWFTDGTSTPRVEVQYPLGHPARRAEALPHLIHKFERNCAIVFSERARERILEVCRTRAAMDALAVDDLLTLLTP